MELTGFGISAVIGALCGVISGFGIGGGSLLMVWMTAVAALDQRTAQGINLLYFIPTSVGALAFHIKNKMIAWDVVIPAVIFGCAAAILSAWIATTIDVTILRKLFGGFLCIVGARELLIKVKK
ncbi:MAG: sulfite exporter TauE/SafE family protein [Oscillospiraceae bacterium]|nr:sulfite exporter TauE/SafE family protein [Oscillospiraceae bacterium]